VSLLAFRKIDAYYGFAKILHGVSFEVEAGERVALLGRNGVGKTTIVNTLYGIARIGSGEIVLAGRARTSVNSYDAARAGIAICPQGRRILAGLTVEENLLLGATADRQGPWSLDKVYELFPALKERRRVGGTSLSGGQQQMIAIGRALMANPDLLVLDEPSEGLAPVIVDDLAILFRSLAEKGTSILLIEQNISLVQRVCERCCVLSKGQVVDSGVLANWSKEQLQQHIMV
jgi:branched-chain amino acid transport system ATP-binding protein